MKLLNQFDDLTILEWIGLFTASVWIVYKPCKLVVSWLLNRFSCASRRLLRPSGDEYAIITGATDGIGFEYARQLAQKGYNLLLISRTESKLKFVAAELTQQFGHKVDYHVADFSDQTIYNGIRAKLDELTSPIHVLVNNVGTAYPTPEYFTDYPQDWQLNLINTNITSMTMMSDIVLRKMLKQEKRSWVNNRGIIINISSMAGTTELPLFSTYAASKSYINNLSKTLSFEYEKDDIIVQTVMPNQVDTKLAKNLRQPETVVSVESYVRYALNTVGTEQSTNGHPKHKILNNLGILLGELIPERWFMLFKFKVSKHLKQTYEERQRRSILDSEKNNNKNE